MRKGRFHSGRSFKLSIADQIFLTHLYLSKQLSPYEIGLAYGVSKTTVYRTVQRVKNGLIESGKFYLSGENQFIMKSTYFLNENTLIDSADVKYES